MGFLDKMKGAVSAVTGGAAKVSIEYAHQQMKPGDSLQVKVTVMSMGREVKSGGVFVDVRAAEQGQVHCSNCNQNVNIDHETVKQSIPVGPAFVLQPNETKTFESTIQLPMGQPTYNGQVRHTWTIRGRLSAFGNDPDSGFQNLDVR